MQHNGESHIEKILLPRLGYQEKKSGSQKICYKYYPFGLQTANSWTRDNTTNNFLGNGGTELNTTTALYDLDYRNYDPILGRMNQVDPMADRFSSHTPYNYSFNSPVVYNDPNGATPGVWSSDIEQNANGNFVSHGEYSRYMSSSAMLTGGGTPDGAFGDIYGDSHFSPMSGEEAIGLMRGQMAAMNGDAEGISEYAKMNSSSPTGAALNALENFGLASRNSSGQLGYYTYESLESQGEAGVRAIFNFFGGQQTNINITVTDNISGYASVRTHPEALGDGMGNYTLYEVPLYEVSVSGVDKNGVTLTKSFSAIRYGVYNVVNGNGPQIIGTRSGTYPLTWDDGKEAWHVDGAGKGGVWLHTGPRNPIASYSAAIGCVSFVSGGFSDMNSFIKEVTGTPNLSSVNANVTFTPAQPPPLKLYKP